MIGTLTTNCHKFLVVNYVCELEISADRLWNGASTDTHLIAMGRVCHVTIHVVTYLVVYHVYCSVGLST